MPSTGSRISLVKNEAHLSAKLPFRIETPGAATCPEQSLNIIKLGRIDTPEKKQYFGKNSTQILSNLIAGKNVQVEYSKSD